MALGTITQVAIDPHSQQGGIPIAVGDVKFTCTNVVGDGAYGAGGSTVTAAQLGLSTILTTDVQILTPIVGVIAVTAPIQAGAASVKLVSYGGSGTTPNIGLAEATGTSNQSGMTVQIQAQGY
jgi:hypothetical protein